MVVLNDNAKLLANPTTIYLIDKGILTLNSGIKKLDVSTFKASSIVESMLFNPPTTDSYKIGKASNMTMNIGAYLLPDRIKNKNTNAAVGALFKTIINGFMNK